MYKIRFKKKKKKREKKNGGRQGGVRAPIEFLSRRRAESRNARRRQGETSESCFCFVTRFVLFFKSISFIRSSPALPLTIPCVETRRRAANGAHRSFIRVLN